MSTAIDPDRTTPDHVEAWSKIAACAANDPIERDYWVALSEHAGVLWIYQQRLAGDETAWYLHGVFA